MAEARRQILITRPDGEALATAERVIALGLVPVLAPLLRVTLHPVPGGPPVDAILVTSRNAVPALPPDYHDTLLLAVGDATASRAREAGFTDVASAEGDAVALADLARQRCPPGGRVMLAHGRGQGASLLAMLREAGFIVHRRRAYTALPAARFPEAAEQALRANTVASALFLSADTARAFARLLPVPLLPSLSGVRAIAIGQPAADALSLLPWRQVRVSLRPTLDHVLALL